MTEGFKMICNMCQKDGATFKVKATALGSTMIIIVTIKCSNCGYSIVRSGDNIDG